MNRRILSFGLFVAGAASSLAGTVNGLVSNFATGNLLAGARVEVPALRRFVLTDATGYYALTDLPAGEHEVVVSCMGLGSLRQAVRVEETGTVRANYDLNAVVKLDPVTVEESREGSALALTAQRNADNVKHVVATDAYFGYSANASPGEMAIRLPGVAGAVDDEGNVQGIIIRGQGAPANRLTVDGSPFAVTNPLARAFQASVLSGAMFERLEVIKAHTPDKPVDSIGGTVNFVTRSPLSMKEKRRFTYNIATRFAPAFTDQIGLRRDHPAHPSLNASYQEVFSVLGGERNLGVALNFSYAENVTGSFRTVRDYQNTTASPAYLFTWATQDLYNNRKQTNVNAKVDYRYSPTTRFSLNVTFNESAEPFNRLYEITALTAQSVATLDAAGNPTGPGAILPDFSSTFTEARALPASLVRVNETMNSSFSRSHGVNLSGHHEFRRWQADWTASYSRASPRIGSAGGGQLSLDATGVGWRLDRSRSDLYPTFAPTGGPDFTNPANYRPSTPLNVRGMDRLSIVKGLRADFTYGLRTPRPVRAVLKAGFDIRDQVSAIASQDRRWNYIGGTRPLAADPSIVTWMSEQTGFRAPLFETAAIIHGDQVDPALWAEDLYYGATQKYINTRDLTETSVGLYLMTKGQVGRLSFLAGARSESSENRGFGWVSQHFFSLPAARLADPVGAAARDWGNGVTLDGFSQALYPSAHLGYDFTRHLKGRVSWSTGYSGAPFNNLLPMTMVDDPNRRLTLTNADLEPQHAQEWDATLEYYFEPAGHFTVGWFHKDITDYIVTGVDQGIIPAGPDNGFNGDFAGYQLLTSENAGRAAVNGWELSYEQQFTFLPGALRTLKLSANYTHLRTHGTYAGSLYLTTETVNGFIPKTGNISLAWRYKAFGIRARQNYTGRSIMQFNATAPARNLFRVPRTVTDLGFSFALRPRLQLVCDISNLTNEPQVIYRYIPSQMERTIISGTTWTVGVNGRF